MIAPASTVLHATTVAIQGRAALIIGPSGSGKSALALQMMALGAQLVADDRTQVWPVRDTLWAIAPPGLPSMIEARGVGLLTVPQLAPATRVVLCVDMARAQTERLPPFEHIQVMGVALPLVFQVPAPHFPSALMHYLIHGRAA